MIIFDFALHRKDWETIDMLFVFFALFCICFAFLSDVMHSSVNLWLHCIDIRPTDGWRTFCFLCFTALHSHFHSHLGHTIWFFNGWRENIVSLFASFSLTFSRAGGFTKFIQIITDWALQGWAICTETFHLNTSIRLFIELYGLKISARAIDYLTVKRAFW